MDRKLFFSIITFLLFAISSHCQTIKIEMEKMNDVYFVPCEVNGLKLKFVFDTGASMVSLSESMTNFMINNGYLSEDNIYDKIKLYQADGSSYIGQKVMLDTIVIGGYILTNIDAVVIPSQNAPLLLGQSVIQKLGKVSIKDNYLVIENSKVKYSGIEKDISFLGLKYGSSYDKSEEVLASKYGWNNILHSTLNDNLYILEVENEIFINKKFDIISLYFEEESLVSAQALKTYTLNELSKAIRFRDELYDILRKKYTASKKLTDRKTNIGYYVLGYQNRKDNNLFPIKIQIEKAVSVIRDGVNDTKLTEGYEVCIKYWPASLNKSIKDKVVSDEY